MDVGNGIDCYLWQVYEKGIGLLDASQVLNIKMNQHSLFLCAGWIVDFTTLRSKTESEAKTGFFSSGYPYLLEPHKGPNLAGAPQGTRFGLWLFIIIINDRSISGMQLWKYVNDITMVSSNPFSPSKFINIYFLLTISIQNKIFCCENKGIDYILLPK